MIAAQQAYALGVMLVSGALCAAVHDVARLAGWMLGGRAAFTALMDLLFGALLAVGMTCAGLFLGMDPMRLYLFAGVFLGALLWYATGGLAARRIGRRMRKTVRREEKSEE